VSHSTTKSIPLHISPSVRPGLDALSLWLENEHYSQHARESILAHAAAEGTPTGSPYLEPGDEAGSNGAFIRALEPVPYSSPAWDLEDVILDAAMLAAGTHPFPMPDDDGRDIPPDAAVVPPELDPDDDDDDLSVEELIPSPARADPDAEPPDDWAGDASVGWVSLPPIRGGGPDETYDPTPTEWAQACALFREPEPFVPSATDLAELHAHRDATEALYGYE
jgi:hypothetical protein